MSPLEICQDTVACIGPNVMIGGEEKMKNKQNMLFKELNS